MSRKDFFDHGTERRINGVGQTICKLLQSESQERKSVDERLININEANGTYTNLPDDLMAEVDQLDRQIRRLDGNISALKRLFEKYGMI